MTPTHIHSILARAGEEHASNQTERGLWVFTFNFSNHTNQDHLIIANIFHYSAWRSIEYPFLSTVDYACLLRKKSWKKTNNLPHSAALSTLLLLFASYFSFRIFTCCWRSAGATTQAAVVVAGEQEMLANCFVWLRAINFYWIYLTCSSIPINVLLLFLAFVRLFVSLSCWTFSSQSWCGFISDSSCFDLWLLPLYFIHFVALFLLCSVILSLFHLSHHALILQVVVVFKLSWDSQLFSGNWVLRAGAQRLDRNYVDKWRHISHKN